MDDGPVCPGEHVISAKETDEFYRRDISYILECNGVTYGTVTIDPTKNSHQELETLIKLQNHEHLIDYLQKEVVKLREQIDDWHHHAIERSERD